MSTGFPQRVCRKEKVMSSSSDEFLKGFFNQYIKPFICDGKHGGVIEFLHAGYLVLGILVFNWNGISAVLFYLAVYSAMNLGAFSIIVSLTA